MRHKFLEVWGTSRVRAGGLGLKSPEKLLTEEPKRPKGNVPVEADSDLMRTNLATVLDPNRRSNDAGEFDAALRRRIVGQDAAVEKVVEIYQMFLAGLNAP